MIAVFLAAPTHLRYVVIMIFVIFLAVIFYFTLLSSLQ